MAKHPQPQEGVHAKDGASIGQIEALPILVPGASLSSIPGRSHCDPSHGSPTRPSLETHTSLLEDLRQ